MSDQYTIESFFNNDEVDGAKKYIEVFHGRLLVSDQLARKDKILLAAYMVSNHDKTSEISKESLKTMTNMLGVDSLEAQKGLYDVKDKGYVTDDGKKIAITFKGLKYVRSLLGPQAETATVVETSTVEAPTITSPGSLGDAITKLLDTNWGKKPRTMREIMEALEVNAIYFPRNVTAAELNRLTRSTRLRRFKTDRGFVYTIAHR